MAYFSVVIPLYNKENFIKNTILSVLNQTFQDFEIIVVNDRSTDKSEDMILSLPADKLTIIKHDKNKGLSAARNTGIKNSSASYIAFLDADDLWHTEYLQKIYALIQNFPEAKLFGTNYTEIHSENKNLNPKKSLKNFNEDGIISDFFEAGLAQPIYCCSSFCVERSVFKTIGYYNEEITFGEDIDFNIRANLSFLLAYSPKSFADYIQQSENQITNKKISTKIIPDFDSYESLVSNNLSLKKYLDFNRYFFAKMYKIENDWVNFKRLKAAIHSNKKISGLNNKQLFLLNSPIFILKIIRKIKLGFLKKGIQITSYH